MTKSLVKPDRIAGGLFPARRANSNVSQHCRQVGRDYGYGRFFRQFENCAVNDQIQNCPMDSNVPSLGSCPQQILGTNGRHSLLRFFKRVKNAIWR